MHDSIIEKNSMGFDYSAVNSIKQLEYKILCLKKALYPFIPKDGVNHICKTCEHVDFVGRCIFTEKEVIMDIVKGSYNEDCPINTAIQINKELCDGY